MLPASAFVSPTLHERTVTIGGETVAAHFRELTGVEFIRLYQAEEAGGEEARARAACALVAATLCEPDGSPTLTMDQALTLSAPALAALAAAARSVNEAKSGNG